MKKKILVLLMGVTLVSLVGCSRSQEQDNVYTNDLNNQISESINQDIDESVDQIKEDVVNPATSQDSYKVNTVIYDGKGGSNDVAVDLRILEVFRGDEAIKLIESSNKNSVRQIDYSESIDSTDYIALKYSVTLPSDAVTSDYGTAPVLDAKIRGTDKETFKYNGYTYIGMSTYNIYPDGYSVKESIKAGETGTYFLVYGIPKGCSDSEYLLEFGHYNKDKTYVSIA